MSKWIRWKGLLGFVAALIILLLFGLLFVDSMIRNSIEYAGSRMVGAKVELDRAELRFSPLGITLDQLQVTDPDQPMQNIIDIRQISFKMDSLHILRRKVLIQDMRVDGVRFHTQRNRSGAIKKKSAPVTRQAASTDSGIKMPQVTLPNIDEVMAREQLKTLSLADDFKTNTQTSKDKWGQIVKDMPGEQQLAEYNTRLENIKQTNVKDVKALAKAIEDLKSLKKDIKNDINYLDSSRQQISGDLTQLNSDLKALKNSPKEEYQRLSNKYTASVSGMANISHLLFGKQAKKYTDMAMTWYKKLEPYMAYVDFSSTTEPEVDRHKGLNIRFKEYQPQPDFLIKLAHVSFETEKGNFTGKLMGITGEQDITRKPITLKLTGNNMKEIGSLAITGSFDHINPARSRDQLKLTIRNYALDKYRLIDQPDMVVYLDNAKSNIKLTARRQNDAISADFHSHVHSIKYNNQASGNEMAMMFLSSINKTRDFNIYGKLRGKLDDYSTTVSSDLDNRLKENMKKHANRRLADFRNQLKTRIQQQVSQPLSEAENKYKEISSMVKNDVEIRKAGLEKEYKSVVAEEKRKQKEKQQRFKQKAKDELKNLLNKYK